MAIKEKVTASAVTRCSPARHRQVGTMSQDQDPVRDSPLESYKHRPGKSRCYRTPQSPYEYKAKPLKKQGLCANLNLFSQFLDTNGQMLNRGKVDFGLALGFGVDLISVHHGGVDFFACRK
jgi:hypothetical protein